MIENYKKIVEHYESFDDPYYFEVIKNMPTRFNENIKKYLLNSIESNYIEIMPTISKETSPDLQISTSIKSYLSIFKDNKYDLEFSSSVKTYYYQFSPIIEKLNIDISDLNERLDNLLNKEKTLSFIFEKLKEHSKEKLNLLENYLYLDNDIKPLVEEEMKLLNESLMINYNNFSKNIKLFKINESDSLRNIYENFLEEFENIMSDLFYKINSIDKSHIKTLSEIYEDNNLNNENEIKKFIKSKELEENSILILNLDKSQKVSKYVIFNDGSIGYFKSDTFKSIKNTNEFKDINIDLEESIVMHMLRKKPKIAKLFSEKSKEFKFGALHSCIHAINTYLDNENILKSYSFDLNIINNSSFEVLDDKMNSVLREHKIKKFAYKTLSKKYEHLLSKDAIPLFANIMDSVKNENEIQDLLGKKIAAIKTPEQLIEQLKKILNHISGFSEEHLKHRLKELEITPKFDKNNIIIFQVDTFEQSKILGSPSWCISREDSYFENYTNSNKKQFFLYDFNKTQTDNDSMIGFTLYDNGNFYTQHLKNDKFMNLTEEFRNLVQELIYINKDEFELNSDLLEELEEKFNKKNKVKNEISYN